MLKGKAWKYGDDVDTDVIIPARYLTSADPEVLKEHCMEDLDPEFAKRVSPGDIIVAGENFGCGSSREHAPLAIKAAGVSCVIAKSFARIFFRNSFNIGLPILECREAVEGTDAGDELEVDFSTGLIRNLSKGLEFQAQPLPEFMQELVRDGGLIPHVKKLIAEGRLSAGGEEPASEEKPGEPEKVRGARMMELENEPEPAGKAAPWPEEEEEEKPPADAEEGFEEEEEEEEEED